LRAIWWRLALGAAALGAAGPAAEACSVCYGDPSSQMVQGAKAGVLLLLGVIGSVLLGIIAVMVTWIRRARALAAAEAVPAAPAPREPALVR
jgi:hypothetical protein